jgi:MFS family permease
MMSKISTFRAFRSRNYRLYFAGQSVSLIGTWMQRTSVSWIVYVITHSPFMLGVSMFATQFPSFLLSLAGGVVSDRYNRYRVLLGTQVLSMIQSLVLALLVFSEGTHLNVWAVISLGTVLGVINAFDVPARQSLVYDMINDKDDLPNAVALNSSMVHLSRLIGPALAGFILEKLGGGTCFLLNACSFVAVITSLLLMKLPPYVRKPRTQNSFADLKDGVTYLISHRELGSLILMLALMALLVLPFGTQLPVYAKVIFKGSASTFGIIDSFIGFGALGGAIFLASVPKGSNLRRILLINTVIFGVALIVFSHMTNFPIALAFLTAAGFGMMSQTTVTNTLLQTQAAPNMRGRVISFFAMSFFGMQPLGALLIGSLSQVIGAPLTVMLEGIIAVLIAIFFSYYVRKARLERAAAIAEPHAEVAAA